MNTQVAIVEKMPRSVLVSMSERYGMEPAAFEQTLRATVVPKDCTKEQFAAFLLVAREYNLNPITKEIFAFPKQGGGIQPIVSVDGWANLINSNPQCDGFSFEDHFAENGELLSITCNIFRKDRKHPVSTTEYMLECRRETSTWKQWPRRMLRHKALIQAARYAFGFAGIVDPDEAERLTDEPQGHYSATPGPRLVPPPAPSLASPKAEEVAPEPQAPQSVSSDWKEYLDVQKDELANAKNATETQAIHDAVTDTLAGARERGEISETDREVIMSAWEELSEK